jgi:hypothetical protein
MCSFSIGGGIVKSNKKIDGVMVVDFLESEYDIQSEENGLKGDIDAEIQSFLDDILCDEEYKTKYLHKSVCFIFNVICEETYCWDAGTEYDSYLDLVDEYIIDDDISKKYIDAGDANELLEVE